MKKCPKGWICIQNISLIILLILVIIIIYLFIVNNKLNGYNNIVSINPNIKQIRQNIPRNISDYNLAYDSSDYILNQNLVLQSQLDSQKQKQNQEDVLLNPYSAPLKNTNYFLKTIFANNINPISTIPININSNIGALDVSFRQLGILTPLNSPNKDNILPLMGRPLFTNRHKFQYYTISNQHNNVKLPISVKGKSGLNEYGVDELFNNDRVYVEGYNDVFKVTIYDNSTMKYIPFI